MGRNIVRFPLIVEFLAMAIALADPRTPAWAKAILAAAIAYVVCPVDVIPDVVSIAGLTDDVGVLGVALRGSARSCVTEKHRYKARELLGFS